MAGAGGGIDWEGAKGTISNTPYLDCGVGDMVNTLVDTLKNVQFWKLYLIKLILKKIGLYKYQCNSKSEYSSPWD